ncbi:cilia- and flagella-associated protein 251-like [Tubulanus polymorphus]|uniref:cilia- and flagella-associated protein 251-like n=1 Tax=Tubulanus polymorphus TaxID=672921 RepID=UPI003DA4649A
MSDPENKPEVTAENTNSSNDADQIEENSVAKLKNVETTEASDATNTSQLEDKVSAEVIDAVDEDEETAVTASDQVDETENEEREVDDSELQTENTNASNNGAEGKDDQTPAEQTPADQTPADQTPAEQTPADQTPADQTPAEQTPADQTPAEQAPADQTPAEQKPDDQTPAEQTPAEQTPDDQTPADQTPAEQTPDDQTPAEQTPAEQTPDDQTPANQLADDVPQSPAQPPSFSSPCPSSGVSLPKTPSAPPRSPEETGINIPSAPPAPSKTPDQSEFLIPSERGMNALNMVWSFGMNINIPVLNITDGNSKRIMYVVAHTGVLYDIEYNTQRLLQGHSNPISCTCVSEDKRWLATADKGTGDNILIIWDSQTGMPVRTMFEPADGGIVSMAITNDAKYLATLSVPDKQGVQTLALWDWTNGENTPMHKTEIDPKYGLQTYVLFNPDDSTQLVSNNESQIIFYSYKNGELVYYAPALSDKDFNKPVGKYSQSVFQKGGSRALTATSLGNLVVWENIKPSPESSPDKKALKLVKIQDKAITVLTTTDRFLVTGDALGHVKYFDQTLKLVNWYQDFNVGPVNALSFAYLPDFDLVLKREDTQYPPDATISAKQFFIRDFVVGSSAAIYAHVTTDGTVIDIIHRDHDSAVHALATHPSDSRVVIGSYSGLLKVWDYVRKKPVASRYFDRGQCIRCCAFDPKGFYLAVGFTNGTVRILDSLTLADEVQNPFHYSHDAVTKLVFSHDSQYLAVADAEFTLSVFERSKHREGEPWLYLGRNRAHYKEIRDVLFGTQLDNGKPRLLSLGDDRFLIEYNLEDSSKDDLKVLASDRIEQSAHPLCMSWYPPITKEQFICTANDQFKLKLYNSTTKMCRKTLLGPTYASPLEKILILPTADEINDKRYMVYNTRDKVGLHVLPLDGNPHNSMALIAHPNGVSNLACSYDGRYVFTAGGSDASVHMWDTNLEVLEAQSSLGGKDLIPFYGLLDGGRDGELFAELEDYFYYAQLRSQGVDTMDTRIVSTKIALSEVPFVMRAMGYYPSEQEVQDMINEVKYSKYVETGKYVQDIDLGEFIKLYVNHRPAFGLSPDKLRWAFETLGIPANSGQFAVERADLLDMLQSRGEHMTEYELAEYLTTLLGFNPEGGTSELQEFDASNAAETLDEFLPQDITAELFASEMLGLSLNAADVLDVIAEQQACT